jgi:hypothetical protein
VSDQITETLALLAEDLARVLLDEPTGVACTELALRVRRRRADVLRMLKTDPRFARNGRGRGSRWRLVAQMPLSRPRDGFGRIPMSGDDPRLIPSLSDRRKTSTA